MTTFASGPSEPSSCRDFAASQEQYGLNAGAYDPSAGFCTSSPPLKPMRPRLQPTPSPPPDIPQSQVSPSPSPTDAVFPSNRQKIRERAGDSVLISYLDNGRQPDIARAAGNTALPSIEDLGVEEDERRFPSYRSFGQREARPGGKDDQRQKLRERGMDAIREDQGRNMSSPTGSPPNLPDLASRALQVFAFDSPRGTRPPLATSPLPLPARKASLSSSLHSSLQANESLSPPSTSIFQHRQHLSPPLEGRQRQNSDLPPLQLPSDTNDKNLPPLKSALGDVGGLRDNLPPVQTKDTTMQRGPSLTMFPASPPGSMPRPYLAHGMNQASPPVSPNDLYNHAISSPQPQSATSPYYFVTNGVHHRGSIDYSSSTTAETPSSTDLSASTPATSTSINDRMSIDGITNQPMGQFTCDYPKCKAPPFQTQYLLSSHRNVHSTIRPHYCPVPTCPRSEGGKGFKRKNEMIRHGLVHESPGYVCPFCPDKEHKYPRPDNLQRHVRVHHLERDKNDPLLRDVLAQRADGPSRGRRRRGP